MSPLSLLQLPVEIQHEIVLAGLEPTDLLCSNDSLRAMIRNRDLLKQLVLVYRVWQELATPLLYETVALGHQKPDLQHSSLLALLDTLSSSPGLCALVRHFHHPPLSPNMPSPYEPESPQATDSITRLLPGLRTLSTFVVDAEASRWRSGPRLDGPLRALGIGLVDGTAFTRIADRFDLSTFARLDVCISGDLDQPLRPISLPSLVDLRLWNLVTEFSLVEPLIRAVDQQLRTLHLFPLKDYEGPGTLHYDIPTLCPSLAQFGFEPWSTFLGTTATWDRMHLDSLLLDEPAAYDPVPSDRGCLSWIEKDSSDTSWFKAIDGIRPKTVILADAPSPVWSAANWAQARWLARVLRQDGRSIALQDRLGTVVEPVS